MATITAAAGGGNWSANASWVGGAHPTASDDVLLTASSGNITIDTAGAAGRSLNCTGYTGTLTNTVGSILSLGDATAGLSSVALKLVATMTYTLVGNAEIDYVSTSATQQTIDMAGLSVGLTRFMGAGSSYLLSSSWNAGAGVNIQQGIVNTNNLAHTFVSLSFTTAGTKTFTGGSSAITISGGVNALNLSTTATFTANTTTWTFTNATSSLVCNATTNMNGASIAFQSSTVTGATVNGNGFLTVGSLTYSSVPIKTASLSFMGGLTLTGTLTVSGSSAVNRVLMQSVTPGTSATITTAAFSFANVSFMDITAAGAGGTWTGTTMGNCLGNSNITFDAPTTQTHTASAGGNWSDATKWTSRVPLPQDTVIVNSSTTGTLTCDMPRMGADVDFTGFAGTWSRSLAVACFGSLTLATGMTITGSFDTTMSARSSKNITSAGCTFPGQVVIQGPTSTYTLQDSLVASLKFILNDGTFAANGFNVTALGVTSGSARTRSLTMGSGTWTLTDTAAVSIWNVTPGGMSLSGTSSTIVISSASANTRTFLSAGFTYGTLTYTVAGSIGTLIVTGSSIFNILNFSDASNARTLQFTAGTTTTISKFNVFGSAGKLITLQSATAATHTLTNPGSGAFATDYLAIDHSIATGGAGWFAGAHSTNNGNNTGWTFTDPTGASSLSSNAALTNAGTPAIPGTVSLSSNAALTNAGTPAIPGAVSLSSNAALTSAGKPAIPGTVSLSSNGALTNTGTPAIPGTVSLSSNGALTNTGTPSIPGVVSLSSNAALTGTGTPAIPGTVSLSSNGAMTSAGAPTIPGTVSLSSNGALDTAGSPGFVGSVSLSSNGALDTSGTPAIPGAVSLSSNAELDTSGTPVIPGAVSLSSNAELDTSGTPTIPGAVSLSSDSALTSSGTPAILGAISLSSDGALTGSGTPAITGAVPLSSNGALASTGHPGLAGSISLSSNGALTNTGIPSITGTVSLSSNASLASAGRPEIASMVSLSSAAILSATGDAMQAEAISLIAFATLTASGSPSLSGSIPLSSDGALVTSGGPGFSGSIALSGNGAFDPDGVPSFLATVHLSSAGSLTVAGTPLVPGAVALSSNPALFGSGNPSISGVMSMSSDAALSASGYVVRSIHIQVGSPIGALAAAGCPTGSKISVGPGTGGET